MRNSIFCYFFLFTFLLGFVFEAYTQRIYERFELGDSAFRSDWSGMTQKFEVKDKQLQSVSTQVNDTFFVARPAFASSAAVQWSLALNLQFNTSSTNYVDWVLFADSANLRQSRTRYYVRIGNTADEVSLYRVSQGGAPEMLINGVDGRLNRSSNPLYLRVERTLEGKWFLWVASDGNPASLQLEGSFQDAMVPVTGHTGWVVRQSTASFFGKHFFSFFYMGPPILDTLPPQLIGCNLIGEDSLQLLFNEPLSSYIPIGPDLIDLQPAIDWDKGSLSEDRRQIIIQAKRPFENLQVYTIQVIGVEDTLGNRSDTLFCTCKRITTSPAQIFDVVIHEVMPTPSPAVALPAHRYIELYNRSKKAIQLAGFSISNKSTQAALPPFILLPDSFVLLCSTTGAPFLAPFGKTLGVVSFPTFSKTADVLTLKDNEGNLLHTISYVDAWYGEEYKKVGGYSLEMRNPDLPCEGALNWKGSDHDAGGTPGAPNSVFSKSLQDTLIPKLTRVKVEDSRTLALFFSEPMLPPTLSAAQSILCKETATNPHTVLAIEPTQWLVYWDAPFEKGRYYHLYLHGMSDCVGNKIVLDSFYFAIPEKANHLDVLITELMIAPLTGRPLPSSQYVELLNRSDKPIDLNGFKFSDLSASVFLPSYVLFPDSRVILCRNTMADSFRVLGSVLGLPTLPTLNKSADVVQLFNASGELIHSVAYQESWYRDAFKRNGGFSLEMIDPTHPCGGAINWSASNDVKGGTPGRTNSVIGKVVDTTPPRLLSVYPIHEKLIALRYNEALSHAESQKAQHYFFPESLLQLSQTPFCSLHIVQLHLSEPLKRGEIYTVLVRSQADCVGNTIEDESMRFGLPSPVKKGDVLLSEILFNPPAGLSEFVECYHAGEDIVDLKDVFIGNLNEDGSVRSVMQVFPDGQLLLPGSYLAFSTSGILLCDTYTCKEPLQVVSVRSLPSYPQQSGGVILISYTGEVLDSFLYSSSLHHPLLKDRKGVSLERVRFDHPAHWKDNWVSAAATAGYASPGYENSQAPPSSKTKGGVALQSQRISPNLDGKDERLALDYDFYAQGFVATLHIFSANGVFICKPIQQQLLTAKGTLYWDLTYGTENQRVIPPGIYILLVEAVHPSGEVFRKKMTFSITH
jgi:hypothetical protein